MEIAPIPGVRAVAAVAAVQPRSNGFDLPAVFAVQDSSRAGDETYNGKTKASTGGQDDEDGLDDGEDEEVEEFAFGEEEEVETPRLHASGPIDFFA